MTCDSCGRPVAGHLTICPHCAHPLGFPNVRAATDPAERTALQSRYDRARADAGTRGAAAAVDGFEAAVRADSRGVITHPIARVKQLLDSRGGLFQTFYRQVAAGRVPEENKYDRYRPVVDAMLFPYYSERIYFAALSLGTTGAASYGSGRGCVFVLNDTIRNRASVFEENCFNYVERTSPSPTAPVPPGLRAAWADRHLLAVAKLAARLQQATTPAEYPRILVEAGGGTGADQFIEVHVHDPLTEAAVARAYLARVPSGLTRTREKVEKALLRAVREQLETLAVPCEVV